MSLNFITPVCGRFEPLRFYSRQIALNRRSLEVPTLTKGCVYTHAAFKYIFHTYVLPRLHGTCLHIRDITDLKRLTSTIAPTRNIQSRLCGLVRAYVAGLSPLPLVSLQSTQPVWPYRGHRRTRKDMHADT